VRFQQKSEKDKKREEKKKKSLISLTLEVD
jgi:hypothetical protein